MDCEVTHDASNLTLLDAIDAELIATYETYVADAKKAAWPLPGELTENVYITY